MGFPPALGIPLSLTESLDIIAWLLRPLIVPILPSFHESQDCRLFANSDVQQSRSVCRSWCLACTGIGVEK